MRVELNCKVEDMCMLYGQPSFWIVFNNVSNKTLNPFSGYLKARQLAPSLFLRSYMDRKNLQEWFSATIAVVISWLTLTCRLNPTTQELQEVTLMKLLYLYDPVACQQVYFYNYTVLLRDSLSLKSVQWIVKNECATSFRGYAFTLLIIKMPIKLFVQRFFCFWNRYLYIKKNFTLHIYKPNK